jgi:hypothetical protein
MNQSQNASHLNVFTVEEFDAPSKEDKGRKAKSWTKIGVAFPHKEGTGFNIQLRAYPVNGSLVVLPAEAAEDAEPAPAARTARR